MFIAAVVLVPLVAGEEIAWRAYSKAPLTRELGTIPGAVVLGLVWGISHAPIALRSHKPALDVLGRGLRALPVGAIASFGQRQRPPVRVGRLGRPDTHDLGGQRRQWFVGYVPETIPSGGVARPNTWSRSVLTHQSTQSSCGQPYVPTRKW